MNNLIERYIHDVIRRLPEKDQEEVRKELEANIYDMLSENASEEEINEVLNRLGAPAKLAEQYRLQPRYLISPAVYDDYIQTVKLVLPIVGIVMLVLSVLSGVFGFEGSVFKYIGEIIGTTVESVFIALVIITAIFVIIDRSGTQRNKKAWTISDLPKEISPIKSTIPLHEGIIELVFTVIMLPLFILFSMGILPVIFSSNGISYNIHLFTPEFTRVLVPVLLILWIIQIVICILKIVYRKWSIPLCILTIFGAVIGIALAVFAITSGNIINQDVFDLIQKFDLNLDALIIFGKSYLAFDKLLIAIIIFANVFSIGNAVYKTIKASKKGV